MRPWPVSKPWALPLRHDDLTPQNYKEGRQTCLVKHQHLKALAPRKTAQWYVDVFGADVLVPMTQMGAGSEISYIKGADGVRIELVQPAS